MSTSEEDIMDWCDEHLPDLYNEGMFDDEDISEEVWQAYTETLQDTLLDAIDDEDERDAWHERVTDTAHEWFTNHHETVIEALPTLTDAAVSRLTNKPQVSQHSADWYAQRRNRLTASEFANILDGRRGALLRSKTEPVVDEWNGTKAPVAIAQEDGEMNATSWGHRFEPVTRAIYELEIAGVGTVCDTLGRFTHATIPWLSASPDGLVVRGPLAGRLVEIKSPKTRQPGEFVPSDYYAQMQIQMEVCDLPAADFVEAQFAQRPVWFGIDEADLEDPPADLSPADTTACAQARWKGRVEVYGFYDDSNSWIYRYTAPAEDLEDAEFVSPPPAGLPLLESSVWWLTGWYQRTVLRNDTWWSAIGWPAASQFWAEVESLRAATPAQLTIHDDNRIEHVGGGWLGSQQQTPETITETPP
jgi:putative phage-type endonuclease